MIDKRDERADWDSFESTDDTHVSTPDLITVPPGKAVSKYFRRLKSDERVNPGDFVSDDLKEFKPWDGPRGFQAGSFVKPIYRQTRTRSTASIKK